MNHEEYDLHLQPFRGKASGTRAEEPLAVLFIRFEAEHDWLALERTIQGIRRELQLAPRVVTCSTCPPVLTSPVAEHVDSASCFLGKTSMGLSPTSMPPQSVWQQLARVEPQALEMMSRRIFRIPAVSRDHHARKLLFKRWVISSYDLLTRHGIERVIHSGVPHTGFEFVLFETARAMGLQTHFLMQLQVKDSFVVARSLAGLEELYAGLRHRGQGSAAATLEPRMQAELARRVDRELPHYMLPSSKSLGRRIRGVVPKGPGLQLASRLGRRLRSLRAGLASFRARVARGTGKTPSEPFVYLPLHLQPEATTLPLGGVHADQGLVVETVLAALPKGWALVVKENPKQRLENREPELYDLLRKSSQVRIASRSSDSFELIQTCMAVATVTGTAGWEALCLGKPAITFGTVFYGSAPGSVHVSELKSTEDLRRVLVEVESGKRRGPQRAELERFLAQLQGITHRGIIDVGYLASSSLVSEEALRIYSETLLTLLGIGSSAQEHTPIPASPSAPPTSTSQR